ncbi:DUF2971 domain-containing protein [Pinirhizobacter soli]|uniref:DUF2971 domain-containing protein n=1 Tax=Pinirhizobacter soli TaxID=2786953 RepID=UPI002029CF64|nr:DUF2971 domain-containing protein [Pinirhizobacter soli]
MPQQPAAFYKYVTSASALAILGNESLKWSRPSCFNDPFDMNFDLRADYDHEEVLVLATDRCWARVSGRAANPPQNEMGRLLTRFSDHFLSMGEHNFRDHIAVGIRESLVGLPGLTERFCRDIREDMARTKILCLSEINDSLLMWSHYAEDHRGAVLEFKDHPDLDSPYKEAFPVDYLEQVPMIATTTAIAAMFAGDENAFDRRITRNIIAAKASAWSYEQEWRIATGAGRNPNDDFEFAPFDPRELTAIYLGCRATPQFVDKVKALADAKYPHAALSRAVLARDRWKMAFTQQSLYETAE